MCEFIIECFLLALGCGIVAAIYRGVLAYEPVMHWWFRFGNRYESRWFFAPVWGCVKCISGQLGLWFYFLTGFFSKDRPFISIFGLLLTICGAILTAIVLAPIIKKLENR